MNPRLNQYSPSVQVYRLLCDNPALLRAQFIRMSGDPRPVRTTVQIVGLLGKGLRVEIDRIAYVP